MTGIAGETIMKETMGSIAENTMKVLAIIANRALALNK